MRKLILSILLCAGCGGGGSKYKVDDQSIAAVSMEDKKGVFQAQTEYNQAKGELDNARANERNVSTELDVAENEYKTAKLQLDTAKLNQKSAELSGDMNKKNTAGRDLRVAELGVKAGDAKVDWLSKKRKWYKRSEDAAEYHVAACDSRYELEKAKLASAKGIKPSQDFDLMNFETDNMQKQQKYSESKMDADRMKADVDGLERQYQVQQQAFEQAKSAAR